MKKHSCLILILATLGWVSIADLGGTEEGPDPLVKGNGPEIRLLAYSNGEASPWAECFISDPEVVSWKPTDRVRLMLRTAPSGSLFIDCFAGDPENARIQVSIDRQEWRLLGENNLQADHQQGARRVVLDRWQGPHEVRARILRRNGTTGPVSFVSFSGQKTP